MNGATQGRPVTDLCCDGAVMVVRRHEVAVDRPDVAVTSLSASVSAAETAALSVQTAEMMTMLHTHCAPV